MRGRLEVTRFESRCLRNNPLKDPHERDIYVYLPPGYDDGGRFPTVMMLPGFGSTHRSLLGFDPWKPNPVERFDRLVASGECAPALLVLPDAINRWGGSQFVDSAATGAYQTYLADEVIPHVDRTFRTIARREARAVVGRSSGGFGALRLGLDRPDRVAAIGSHAGDAAFDVSMQPMFPAAAIAFEQAGGLEAFAERIVEQGPRNQIDFDGVLLLAASAAYAPDARAPLPHTTLPFDPRTAQTRQDVWERWLRHDPLRRIAEGGEALQRMHLVYLDAGDRDEHGLQFAARLLADAVRAAGGRVHHEEFAGGHRGTSWRYDVSLPRLVGALATE